MIPYLLAFIASFAFIFLKSWQQQNVTAKQYWWIPPTSMAMAVMEVYVIATTAHTGWGFIVLPIGLGGGLGSLCSTYLHSKMTAPKQLIIDADARDAYKEYTSIAGSRSLPKPARPAPPMPECKPAKTPLELIEIYDGRGRVTRYEVTRIPEMDIV